MSGCHRSVIMFTLLLLSLFSSSHASDWLEMPDGKLYHVSCVHHHEQNFHVEHIEGDGSTVVKEDGTKTFLPPCAYPTRTRTNEVSYYSDWSVYAETTSDSTGYPYNFMTSAWQVPPAPTSRGPLGLSSVYLFNGLEDGAGKRGNASLILQPVLQFGKSGCLLNPLDWGNWWITGYLVDGNGRAHCGKTIKVQPNDTVVGNMTQTDAASNTWAVSASANGVVSSYTISLPASKIFDAAYVTLEGMVIYNCATYPHGGGVSFTNIGVANEKGPIANSVWKPEIRHSECQQEVSVASSDQVKLIWQSA